jgi:cytochrome P450
MHIKPQGPKDYPFIGSITKLASANRLNWLQSMSNNYGDVVRFKLLKRNVYFVNHPDLVKDMLTRSSSNYTKKDHRLQNGQGCSRREHLYCDGR